MKSSSKNFSSDFTIATCFAIVFLLFAQSISACSWDYPIWQVRSKNAQPYYRFLKGDKAGFIDRDGKIIVKPTLGYYGNSGMEFFDGMLLAGASAGPYIEKTGKIVLDTKYERNWDFSEGLAVAMKENDGKWGFIDKTGKFVISPRFETYPNGYVFSFSDGLAMIQVKNNYGYIDRTGEFVISPKFLKGRFFSEGLAWVIAEGPCVRFDDDAACDSPETLGDKIGDETVSKCKFALINKSGEIISSRRFDQASEFSEDLAAVKIGDKWGFIDKRVDVVISPQFDQAGSFSDGLAAVKQDKLWGFIDKKGQIVIPVQFEDVERFSDGLAPVGSWDEKEMEYTDYYYINKSGKQAFPGKFEKASFYFKGVAHVKLIDKNKKEDEYYLNGKYAYINTSGNKIFTYKRNGEE